MLAQRRRGHRKQRRFKLDDLEIGEAKFFATRDESAAQLRARVDAVRRYYRPKEFVVALASGCPEGVVCERVE